MKYSKLIVNPKSGVIFLFLILIVFPFICSLFFGETFFKKLFFFIIFFLLQIIFCEIIFIILYSVKHGYNYTLIPKKSFDQITVEPHPHLPFIYKKNFTGTKSEKITYPLSDKYYAPQLKTNNIGFYNGENGDRDIAIPKPENFFRINCLGASTTGNYLVSEDKKISSYPLELERLLNSKNQKRIEVNNCAQGGYNSADILVRFALQIIDTKPDLIILYHGYNDIRSYLVSNFKSDYSNSRKNIGETYWKYYFASKIPYVPIKFFNFLLGKWMPFNDRYYLIDSISKGSLEKEAKYQEGLNAYRRNMQHILNLCKANNIDVMLSTFCFYLHSQVKNSSLNLLYFEIVNKENMIIRDLAKKNEIPLVDNELLIEKKDENFLDTIHFSPKGMKLIAENFSNKIQNIYKL